MDTRCKLKIKAVRAVFSRHTTSEPALGGRTCFDMLLPLRSTDRKPILPARTAPNAAAPSSVICRPYSHCRDKYCTVIIGKESAEPLCSGTNYSICNKDRAEVGFFEGLWTSCLTIYISRAPTTAPAPVPESTSPVSLHAYLVAPEVQLCNG